MLQQAKKVLVANRGEIAIRVFRACTELGIPTVAIYAYEDRFSLHRYKADESYQVGHEGTPVASYLDIDEIVAVAKACGATMIHPGYGFLSERADFLEAIEREGLTFVGPTKETLTVAGDKIKTRALAASLNVPIIPGSEELSDVQSARAFAKECGYPVMVKASSGGGGRGLRVARTESELESAFKSARAEAQAAFGREAVFIEKYIEDPKHLEVQLLGDGQGNVIHLFERDCSVQRRHQKIIEYAPALSLGDEARTKLHDYALALGKELKLRAAATAEFLLAGSGELFFIEINPRIQVEHTVTEEITGIDLVQSQLRVISGESLTDLDLAQDSVDSRGVAVQCRITTEDPAEDFEPDYGKLVTYRSASGFGIRLDAGSAFTGAEVLPFYDSLLVKVTSRGRTMNEAAARLGRALAEFRVRGVKTNIPFLQNLLRSETFLDGACTTTFLEKSKDLFVFPRRRNRANRLLRFLGEITVNGHELIPNLDRPVDIRTPTVPEMETDVPPPGWRDRFQASERGAFLQNIRDEKSVLITDTTFRDAHQSLLATRMRTYDMVQIADVLARNASELFSVEMWGGATFDVALRFLRHRFIDADVGDLDAASGLERAEDLAVGRVLVEHQVEDTVRDDEID